MTTTLPTINSNGTPEEQLYADNAVAYSAVRKALKIVSSHGPNGRDYPNDADLQRAVAEHEERCDKLNAVLKDYAAIAKHLDS